MRIYRGEGKSRGPKRGVSGRRDSPLDPFPSLAANKQIARSIYAHNRPSWSVPVSIMRDHPPRSGPEPVVVVRFINPFAHPEPDHSSVDSQGDSSYDYLFKVSSRGSSCPRVADLFSQRDQSRAVRSFSSVIRESANRELPSCRVSDVVASLLTVRARDRQ